MDTLNRFGLLKNPILWRQSKPTSSSLERTFVRNDKKREQKYIKINGLILYSLPADLLAYSIKSYDALNTASNTVFGADTVVRQIIEFYRIFGEWFLVSRII